MRNILSTTLHAGLAGIHGLKTDVVFIFGFWEYSKFLTYHVYIEDLDNQIHWV